MSCGRIDSTTNCPCDERVWPPQLEIPAGLDTLPRQLVDFDDLRAAMLARVRSKGALVGWEARDPADYGVMLLELWAWVGNVLAIYDKAIADESYVRTAQLRRSLRRMTALLGYRPRPAVAATVELALIADGKQPLVVPAGTGFRSNAFDGEKPQVFELIAPATIHPAANRFAIETPRATTLTGAIDHLLLDPANASAVAGDLVLVELGAAAANAHVRRVTAIDRVVDAGQRLVRVGLDRAVDAGAGTPIDAIRLRRPSRKVALKNKIGNDSPSFYVTGSGGYWVLDGVFKTIRSGDRLLVGYGADTRWVGVGYRAEWNAQIVASTTTSSMKITTPSGDVTVPGQTIPAVRAPHSWFWTNDDVNAASRRDGSATTWANTLDPTNFVVHLDLVDAGRVVGATRRTITPADPLRAPALIAPTSGAPQPRRILLRDAEARGAAFGGAIDWSAARVVPDPGAAWTPALATPVEGFANVVTAVRGETVDGEVLGSGDAALTHQRFTLAKKPLTYVAAPSAGDAGIASTLRVWVDGLEWAEVPSFFGHGPTAQVFVIRQDDDGGSAVEFGDGVRGARLSTGVDNVVARYRFGAGAAAPPANAITQLARPVPGLASIASPVAAGGGADAEPAASLRELAPPSALLLGRAISIADFEVAARLAPGVTTARAEWRWDEARQRPVVKVWVLGGANVPTQVAARLRAIADAETSIDAAPAIAVPVALAIDLEIDPRRSTTAVVNDARELLDGTRGILRPAHLGIAAPLFRSRLMASLLDVPGVTGVRGVTWNGGPLPDYGVHPGTGAYFDLAITVTGSAAA